MLQGAVSNLMHGTCTIEADAAYEVMLGLSKVHEAAQVTLLNMDKVMDLTLLQCTVNTFVHQ